MALKFTTSREAAQLRGVKMLVYGKAGVGKTSLCATAPKPFIISAEAGLLSLKHLDIPCVEITSIDDLNEVYLWASTSAEAKSYCDTLCLDSITEIGDVVLNKAKATVKDPRQAYGEMQEKVSTLMRAFRDLPGYHVYFSAQQQAVTDDMGVTTYGPRMPGKQLGPQIPYLFDEVFVLGIGKLDNGSTYRFLRTQPDLQFDAKDRSGALAAIEEPNLTKVIDKITSHVIA